ncbi:TonB-dependent receptor [Chitinophaga rhizophila]|uniref:TonB-dependent receptor n=1 Tax=Chitinophaga rhizophila TaxID=2866212 RepID=A0ABS7GBY9_9BACT|nr:TonB-dependent receptor [Chitinophaga rhizophila]MBW8684650.1 TonB-dependent receptor [Chitinophaga rhizophila]
MKYSYLMVLMLVLAIPPGSFAQRCLLAGDVKDVEGNTLPFASVIARFADNYNKVVNAQADSAGNYRLRLSPGRYILSASFLNANQPFGDTLVLTGDSIWHTLTLHTTATRLSGVTVTALSPPVTAEKGKIVFNVQNAANEPGQTALDLLSKIPGITVDGEGNITYAGSNGVNIMVNGRMTYLSGPQLANYLKGLNTADLAKIELITSPDASFDAAGNAGIINIVSRKKFAGGLAIDLRSAVSAGRYLMTNQHADLTYAAQKISLYGSFDFNTPHKYLDRKGGNVLPKTDNQLYLERNTGSAYKIRYYTWRTGAVYRLHPRHTIGVHYHGYLDDFTCVHSTTLQTLSPSGRVQTISNSRNNIIEPYHYDAVNLTYQYDLDSLGKKLTLDADYTSYRNYSDAAMHVRDYLPDGTLTAENTLSSYQPGFVKIRSVKADAELPFNSLLVKAGLKYAAVTNDNNFRFDSLQHGVVTEVDNISNHFRYNERIAAAYVFGTMRLKKTSFNAGLRLEHTDASADLLKQGSRNKWNFLQLFPSFSIEHTLNDYHNLSVQLSRRINRPGYTALNPVRWYRDPYFYYSGNPGLIPDLAWNVSATYSLHKKYIFNIGYRHSNRYLSEQLAFDEYSRAIRSQTANLGAMQRGDLRIAIPLSILPVWQVQGNANISYTTYPISMISGSRQFSQWAASLTLQQDFTLPAGIKATVSSYLTTAELHGIYRTRPIYYHDAGVKKSVWQNKCTIQVSVSDIFNTSRLQGVALTDYTDFHYNDKPDTRRVGVAVTYHFGGRSVKQAERKTEEQERL